MRGTRKASRFLSATFLGWSLLLAGCHSANDASNGAAASSTSGPAVTNQAVRDALDQKNFGQAVTLANQLTGANPHDADAWLLDADANAAAGNRLEALGALSHALDSGLKNTAQLESDAYLADLRDSSEYEHLLEQHGLQSRPLAQAGDTSISQTSNGTIVRAGDVSVSLPDSK